VPAHFLARKGAVLLAAAALTLAALLNASDGKAQTQLAVEYYHAGWGYYFVTSFPDEIAALDGGAFGGVWKRTGQTFTVWTQGGDASAVSTCRFFSTAFAPKSSHFYTPFADECALVKTEPAWQYEGIAFYVALADANGMCGSGTTPLYRLYNNGMGGAPNHRYTTNLTILNQMLAAGWVFEGNGKTMVFACVPQAAGVQPTFSSSAYQSGTVLYLENRVGTDVVRLGMDTSLGGGVTEFSLNGSDVVAKTNYGSHVIGLGLYDGNGTYDDCNGCTGTYGWNPVECCDTYRHGSPVLAQSIIGDTVYIKTNALEWIPDDKGGGPNQPVPSDIVLERWFSPVPNYPYVFRERYRITHTGNDTHASGGGAPSYEITATIFDQFAFYTGTAPGTAAAATILPTAQMVQWPAIGKVQWLSENWFAFTNQQGFGFAAYSPQAFPYGAPSQSTNQFDQELGCSFLTPLSFSPGSSIQFDTFLMLGNYKTLQLETYDIQRILGPFADVVPPRGAINSDPVAGSTVSGSVSVDGWAFDSVSSTSVELYVDDVLKASGLANLVRPDIANAFPGAPPNPAFHFILDTTQLANGQHTIEVRALDEAGNVALLPHRIVRVQN